MLVRIGLALKCSSWVPFINLVQLSLILELAKQEVRQRYIGSLLGIWWAFIWPTVNIFIYILIFSKILGPKIGIGNEVYNYGLYISSGIIPWVVFANSISHISNIFLEKKYLITKIPLRLEFLPFVILVAESLTFMVGIIFLLIVLKLLNKPVEFSVLFVIIIYIVQVIFTYGLGLFFAILNVFIRDIREIVSIILQIWFWCTPIIYTVDILPDFVKNYIILNPVYIFIDIYRKVLITLEGVGYKLFIIHASVSIIIAIIAVFMLKKLEKDIRDLI